MYVYVDLCLPRLAANIRETQCQVQTMYT